MDPAIVKLVNDRHSTDFEVGVPKKMFQFNEQFGMWQANVSQNGITVTWGKNGGILKSSGSHAGPEFQTA